MYFKEKEDTNIDHQFEKNKKINSKLLLYIVGGIFLLGIIIFIIFYFINNSKKNTLELLGETKITLTKDSDYIEPGYTAYDKKNNEVTNQVKVTSNVDTSKTGEYEIVYSVNGISRVRYITVTEGDTFIYLNGNVNMHLKVGEKYKEPGYTVYDSIDQNLTEKVKVSGKVDTSKVGTYQITYSVVNSRNITVTKKRTVVVTK